MAVLLVVQTQASKMHHNLIQVNCSVNLFEWVLIDVRGSVYLTNADSREQYL